jgi:excinuclease ABC subunit C
MKPVDLDRADGNTPDRVDLETKLAQLPSHPGVYRFLDSGGRTLYVGKAKSLRARVRSYFRASAQHAPHISRMVKKVVDLDIIVVDTEKEALILEANLIKSERPRYNVVLRDDKNFPYLRVSVRDTYPRASLGRRARLDGSRYVGPFLPASTARRTMKMLQRYFQVATCGEVFDGKRRPCLYYHLDQCLAPCAGKTTPEAYGLAVKDALLFLDGRHRDLERSLEQRMLEASRALEYERATRLRDTLRTMRALGERQRMTSVGLEEQDFFAHHVEGTEIALQLFQMRQGHVQARREFTLDDIDFESAAFYAQVLLQVYAEVQPPPTIYLAAAPEQRETLEAWLADRRGGRVRIRIPERGPKKQFLELVRKNATLAFEARFRAARTHGVRALDELASLLGLDDPPLRIECFDISNLQGTDSVASLVVWEGGKPRKADYRSFNVKTVEGSDDTASIAEAVGRRYRRLLAENRRLPDLILIDGGKGQLGAAVAALTRVGLPMLPVVSLAKREEEIFRPGETEPLRLDERSAALQLVQRIRDEAHRFAVSRHRRRRSRRTLKTELTELPGIGPVRARALLKTFGSLKGVREADEGDLAAVVGAPAARAIRARYGA